MTNKLDSLLDQINEELNTIDGPDRMVQALEVSCSIIGVMLHNAHDEVLPAVRLMAWDGFSSMMNEYSGLLVKREEI